MTPTEGLFLQLFLPASLAILVGLFPCVEKDDSVFAAIGSFARFVGIVMLLTSGVVTLLFYSSLLGLQLRYIILINCVGLLIAFSLYPLWERARWIVRAADALSQMRQKHSLQAKQRATERRQAFLMKVSRELQSKVELDDHSFAEYVRSNGLPLSDAAFVLINFKVDFEKKIALLESFDLHSITEIIKNIDPAQHPEKILGSLRATIRDKVQYSFPLSWRTWRSNSENCISEGGRGISL